MRLITPTERIALKTAYDQGVELGHSRGIELGRSQGIELGRSEVAREFVFSLAEEKMGPCPPDCRSRIEAIQSSDLLKQLRCKLGSVKSWDELPIP